jgi:hypothetical protein
MADPFPTPEARPQIAFYEVFPTPVLDRAVESAQSRGHMVRRGFEPYAFHILFAHVADNAWNDVLTRAHSGAICVRVSSVERPFVPGPGCTDRGVLALELIPAVTGIEPAGWQTICSILSDPGEVRSILAGTPRPDCARLFSEPRPPRLLTTLWLRCAAFIFEPAVECRERWRDETLRCLMQCVDEGKTLTSCALEELGCAARGVERNGLVRFLDALTNGSGIKPQDVRSVADLLTVVINQPRHPPAWAETRAEEVR